jgi:hypothetical protein
MMHLDFIFIVAAPFLGASTVSAVWRFDTIFCLSLYSQAENKYIFLPWKSDLLWL